MHVLWYSSPCAKYIFWGIILVAPCRKFFFYYSKTVFGIVTWLHQHPEGAGLTFLWDFPFALFLILPEVLWVGHSYGHALRRRKQMTSSHSACLRTVCAGTSWGTTAKRSVRNSRTANSRTCDGQCRLM